MAQFAPAYQIVRNHEGFYANNPADKGGETYAGIARNIWPNWDGWVIIDFDKRTKGPIANNQQVAGLEGKVELFYRNLWDASKAAQINSQEVANIYFDFYVLHSQAVRAMQEVLNELGYPVATDNAIGPQTISAINAADPAKLHDAYKAKRIEYHNRRVQQDPSQQVFYAGWVKRANLFPSLANGGVYTGLLVLALGVGIFLVIKNSNKDKS